MKKAKTIIISLLIVAMSYIAEPNPSAYAGVPFNYITDIDYGELDYKITGICFCKKKWWWVMGIVFQYWEPFMLIDTSHESNYSAAIGTSVGNIPSLNGKNKSQDVADPSESNFAQSHAFLIPIIPNICSRWDYGAWWSEVDPTWQSDTLSAIITPESTLFANYASQMACSADAAATNVGFPLDALPWCIGSGGSSYPMTGHVADDDIIQANSTAAARLIYKLNRIGMICDAAAKCGCMYTPVWIKSHYKMAAVRPNVSSVYPLGKSAMVYGAGQNPPFSGSLGPNDQFLWVVYRLQRCCTCCE